MCGLVGLLHFAQAVVKVNELSLNSVGRDSLTCARKGQEAALNGVSFGGGRAIKRVKRWVPFGL